jgi:UDP-glucose 4-epimerase
MRQGMVSIYMAFVAHNKTLLVKGSKDRFRDFVYIEDAVDAFYRCLDKNASGKIYNVATGRQTFVWQLIDQITEVFGHVPGSYPITYENPTIQDQFGIYGNSKLIHRELGWKPKTSLEEGIRMMSEWVKEYVDSQKRIGKSMS